MGHRGKPGLNKTLGSANLLNHGKPTLCLYVSLIHELTAKYPLLSCLFSHCCIMSWLYYAPLVEQRFTLTLYVCLFVCRTNI